MDPAVAREETEHSLPVSAEEIRTESVIKGNPHSGRTKRRVALIAICVTAFALIIGFTAAIVQNRVSHRSSESAEDAKEPVTAWNPIGTDEPEDESLSNTRAASRLDDVVAFLSARISEKTLFNDQQSPQYRAAKWVADQDFLNVPIPANPDDYDESYEFVQRYIMAVFYFAMDGVNWRYKAYFMSSYEVCDWNMDFNEPVPGQEDATDDWLYGVQCDEKGAISTIFMPSNGLKGQLPESLGDLLDLDHLSLYSNEISGSIPARMQFMEDIDFLNLESNQMSGKLPTWINKWKSIEYLNLGKNDFTGPVPDLTGLDYLLELAVDGNRLTGSIDAFAPLIFAQSLFLSDNLFTGSFGDNTWENLDSLVTIDISTNNIKGTVPGWVYQLRSVDLHDNDLNSTLKEVEFPRASPLEFFSVYGNNITGTIPPTFGDLESLYHLDLGDNYLTGTIPDEFYYLEDLEVLYLTDNNLRVLEFPDLSGSPYLQELGLGDSQVFGTIPHWVGGKLPDLAVLDLRDNDLTGTIPINLSYLDGLEILLLNYNELAGPVPDFSGCQNLSILFIDNNAGLTGNLEAVCNAGLEGLTNMFTDCSVPCSCCAKCCVVGEDSCNDWDETLRLSDREDREEFLFSEDKKFTNTVNTSE